MGKTEDKRRPFYATLGRVLQLLRVRRGLTADQLIHVVTPANLSKIEAGQVQPGLAILMSLCDVYEVTLSVVLMVVQARLAGLPIREYAVQTFAQLDELVSIGLLTNTAEQWDDLPIKKRRTDELKTHVKELAAEGQSNTEIARRLGVSLRTVQRHQK